VTIFISTNLLPSLTLQMHVSAYWEIILRTSDVQFLKLWNSITKICI